MGAAWTPQLRGLVSMLFLEAAAHCCLAVACLRLHAVRHDMPVSCVLQGFSVADFLKAIEDLVQREAEQAGKQQ